MSREYSGSDHFEWNLNKTCNSGDQTLQFWRWKTWIEKKKKKKPCTAQINEINE